MNDWHIANQLAGLPGMPMTVSGVVRKAKIEQWTYRDVPGKGGPNGTRREYHKNSLPEETLIHLLTGSSSPVPAAPNPEDLESYLSARRITLSPAQLADPKMQAKIAVARAVNACPAYSGRERLITALATQHNVTPITIRRWVDDINTLPAKSSAPRIKLGDERIDLPESYRFTPEALACGLSFYANDMKAGMKAAYRSMESQAPARNWQLADYSNFTRIVKKLPPALLLRIRKGATGFELHGIPKIIKQWTAIPVQSVLCGDQKIFDYTIYDPETDQIINPNGYLWMDCSSRLINGAWIELGHYNSHTVGHALREALRFGNPNELYTDWGKPEGSRHITGIRGSLNGHSISGDFAEMQDKYGLYDDEVRERKSRPGVPWVKPIENINNLIEQRLTAKSLPGYRKRLADAWENKEIQELLKKQAKHGQLMTPERFITEVYTVIDEHNRAQKELKEGLTIVPMDYFSRGLMTQSRPVFDSITLDYICLPRVDRKPTQSIVNVMVKGEKRGYYSPKLSGWRGNQGKVWVSYDPYDAQAPAVIAAQDGSIIDIAEPWHVQNPYDREGVSRKRHRQAELMKWVNEQARRLKAGFDIYKPEVTDKPIKITSATATAAQADKQVKIYHLHKEEAKKRDRDTAREANVLREKLQLKLSSPEIEPFTPPPEGKERYSCWLTLASRKAAQEPLSTEESEFLERYPKSADYRNEKRFHDLHGELYIRTKPLTIIQNQEVNE
jgi:hypothetical protein